MINHILRKELIIGILCLLLFLSTQTTPAISLKNHSPSTKGLTLYVGGLGPNNYTHIQDAIDNANTDDTVFVFHYSSPYYENIIINKSIHLIGENRDTTIIDGNETGGHLIKITMNYVHLSGFTLQNSGGIPNAACIIISSNHNIITDNHISCIPHHGQEGIWLNNANSNTITHNTIAHHHYGIWLENSQNNNISHNYFTDMWSWALILGNSHNNILSTNTFEENNGAIYLRDSNDNNITTNDITNNYRGIILTDQNTISTDNTITQNNFRNNGKTDASFHLTRLSPGRNSWTQNYWNRPRTLPKIILGAMELFFIPGAPFHFPGFSISIPWINIDMQPAQTPYIL